MKLIFTPAPEKAKKGGKGGKEAKPKKGAKGGKSPAETPVKTPTETPDIPVDEIIASRTFHLSHDKSENLIHCGGGPLVMENFIDPLEAAKDGQNLKRKKAKAGIHGPLSPRTVRPLFSHGQ